MNLNSLTSLTSLRALTWGTVAAAVLSALWLAVTEPGAFDATRDAATEITSGNTLSSDDSAGGVRRPSSPSSRDSSNDAEALRR